VPWATGKHQLTRAYMLYLAHGHASFHGRRTAQSLHTSGEKVQHAVAMSCNGVWSIASWVDSGHRRGRKSPTVVVIVSDAGLPDRGGLHAVALGG